eukprot:212930-Amphidinium_carterae.2
MGMRDGCGDLLATAIDFADFLVLPITLTDTPGGRQGAEMQFTLTDTLGGDGVLSAEIQFTLMDTPGGDGVLSAAASHPDGHPWGETEHAARLRCL